jgi:hypothetical protein
MVWSLYGGWSPEEEQLLLSYFGEDTTLDIMERSPVDRRVVITWVEWDRLPPSIYLVDFRERTQYDTPVCVEFMSAAEAKASKWADCFPDQAEKNDELAEKADGRS